MDLPSRSAHPRPTVLAMRLHRRPRVRSNPSVLQVPEPRCRTSLGTGGGICSRGRPGIPSRTSDLVTMNARATKSDSFLPRVLCQVVPTWGLAFLDLVLHNTSHNGRRNHTHPEGRRDRPIEAPATTRNFRAGAKSDSTELGDEVGCCSGHRSPRGPPIAPREDGGSCCPDRDD
jgi:hypothetical protein